MTRLAKKDRQGSVECGSLTAPKPVLDNLINVLDSFPRAANSSDEFLHMAAAVQKINKQYRYKKRYRNFPRKSSRDQPQKT